MKPSRLDEFSCLSYWQIMHMAAKIKDGEWSEVCTQKERKLYVKKCLAAARRAIEHEAVHVEEMREHYKKHRGKL